jgi:hypothetical protein
VCLAIVPVSPIVRGLFFVGIIIPSLMARATWLPHFGHSSQFFRDPIRRLTFYLVRPSPSPINPPAVCPGARSPHQLLTLTP